MSLVDSEWISDVSMRSVAWSRLREGTLCPSCQPTPGQLWFALPTLVSGRDQAHRCCCCTGGAPPRLAEQPEELGWSRLIAEADEFRVKPAGAHSPYAKAEEKVKGDREWTWLTVGGLGEARENYTKVKRSSWLGAVGHWGGKLMWAAALQKRKSRVECRSPAAPLEKVIALRKLQYHYLPCFKNHLFFFFFFLSQSNVLVQICFF